MKKAIYTLVVIPAVAAVMATGTVNAADTKKPAPAKTAAPAAEPTPPPPPPKSVFEDPKPGYTDPFYPNSSRIAGARPQTGGTAAAPVVSVPIEQLIVKSIIIGKDKTAQINDKIVTEGDSALIKIGKLAVQVRVIEIRPRSVLVKVDALPEPKESFLRSSP